LSMERPEKVAMPVTTVMAAPPLRVPPAGLVPMARLTFVELSEVSMLPLASSTTTCTAGVMALPAVPLEGPTMNASVAEAPGVMLNATEVAAVYEGELEATSV